MIAQKQKTIMELKRVILDIENYNKEWRYTNELERLINRMNTLSNQLNLMVFKFEDFHYSSTKKTINATGFDSLLRHTKILKEALSGAPLPTNETKNKQNNDKVFIVHGRDNQAKLEAENMIHRNGLEPVVLDRSVNSGLTLIEKFEKCSDVKYVIVLLTPDDIGALIEKDKQLSELNLQFRARQNVIFELGYFYGKLGRSKVCCIQNAKVELPSDIKGIAYLSYQKTVDEIEHKLMQEIKNLD